MWSEAERTYIARVKEFPAREARGPSRAGALRDLKGVAYAVVKELVDSGAEVPERAPRGRRKELTASSDKAAEAERIAAESLNRFRAAADRELESRDGPDEERLRVLDESIREEGQAIEEFGRAVDLNKQAVREHEAPAEKGGKK